MSDVLRLGELLLTLRREAGASSGDDFRERAFAALQRAIAFDSGVWASGALARSGPDFHATLLFRQPPELLRDYEALKHLDPLFRESREAPGTPVRGSADPASLPPEIVAFTRRYGLAHAMSVMHTDPHSRLLTGLSIWRANPGLPFSAEDEAMLQAAFPHLMANATDSVLAELERFVIAAGAPQGGRACATLRGRLLLADDRAVALLRREFPRWTGPDLPAALAEAARSGKAQALALAHCVARLEPVRDAVFVALRERSPLDDLTRREREVVALLAEGATHRQIARKLGLAPATVRNHIANVHERLGVHNRAALVRLVRDAS